MRSSETYAARPVLQYTVGRLSGGHGGRVACNVRTVDLGKVQDSGGVRGARVDVVDVLYARAVSVAHGLGC